MTASFFIERKAWSQDKHAILGRYLVTAARILHDLEVVDLMAGPGQFEDGQAGSPLLAVLRAHEAHTKGYGYRIHCVFSEADPDMYKDLDKRLAGFPTSLWCAHRGPWQDHVSDMLRDIGDRPALIFADPFGAKGLEWKAMQPFYGRNRTELLVNFNIVHFRRLAGFLESGAEHREGWLRVVDATMGDQNWREPVGDSEGDARDQMLLSEYLSRLKSRANYRYAAAQPVRDPASGYLKYYLVFATRHPKGLDRMNDVMIKTSEEADQRRVNHRLTHGGIQTDFFEQLRGGPVWIDRKVELADAIVSLNLKEATFEGIRYQLLTSGWFGRADSTDFRAAVKRLIQRGDIADPGSALKDGTLLRFMRPRMTGVAAP